MTGDPTMTCEVSAFRADARYRATMALVSHAPEPFGSALKRWRAMRRLSQLDLALEAGISSRHLCFLETGKAQPSRAMVITLADALDMPRDARNALLEAAGFAALYKARPTNDPGLALPLEALAWTLDRHAPYPAFAFDRWWRLVRANPPAQSMLAAAGLGVGDSLLEAIDAGGRLRAMIENWPDISRYMLARLRTELGALGADPVLEAAVKRLAAEPRVLAAEASGKPIPAVLPVIYRLGPARLSFISTVAHFGGAEDLALTDLRIEHLFPADEATKRAMGG